MRRLRGGLTAFAAGVLALVLAAAAGADDVASAPANVTITAGDTGATVTLSITATDDDGQTGCNADATTQASVTFTPDTPVVVTPSGLSFDSCGSQQVVVSAQASATAGDYNVAVAASGGIGGTYNVSPTSIAVHVNAAPPPPDTTPPVISVPASTPTAEATGPTGALVSFAVSAVDNVDGSIGVSCTPPSSSTFPLGNSPVTCTATDTSNNSSQETFTVTVTDTTPPTLSLTPPASTEATSAAGAAVTFGASATDLVDGSRPVNCSPTSGTTFPIGTTTVNCSAADSRSNTATGTLSVTVTDGPPTVTVPPTQTAEASGASGAPVAYIPAPTAADFVDGPLGTTCSKPSGSVFPLGQTTVTCTATDSKGSSASASFQVVVRDTTPPVVTAPPAATFVAEGSSLSRSFPALAAYLARGRAADLVDQNPTLYVDAPLFFPLGPSVVTYTAVDGSGNRDSATTTITIVPPPPPGQRAPTPPPDDPPPANVTALRATPGNALVRLSWTAPRDADVVRYAAFRSERTGPIVQVYGGAARSFVDRGLVNGVEYRYVVVAYDRGGNRSVGVAVLAKPRLPMLLAPREGARLAKGTTFSWRRVAGARYYNFQLFRVEAAGRAVKILSVWPVTNSFRLRATWRFEGRSYRLTPGAYRWFVWPGFGARADSRYGELLGQRSFTITRQRR